MTAQAKKQLQKKRNKIDSLDKKLLQVLAQRFSVVSEISRIKKKMNWPIIQAGRKRQINITRLKQARLLKLQPQLVKALFELIHQESIRIQKKERKS